jgi:hypothetical protein
MERDSLAARYVGPVERFSGKTGTATPMEELWGPGRLWRFQIADGQAIQCLGSDIVFLRTRQ